MKYNIFLEQSQTVSNLMHLVGKRNLGNEGRGESSVPQELGYKYVTLIYTGTLYIASLRFSSPRHLEGELTIQWEDRNKKLKVDSFLIWTKQLLFHNLVMGMDISLIDSLTF